MANTGPHSSGGQFIITLVNDPQFDDKNSAFGTVRQHYYTYNAQGQATGVSNGRDAVSRIFNTNTTVSISRISFRRRGEGAESFDETQHFGELPDIRKVPITRVEHTATQVLLHHPAQEGGFYRAYGSVDLNYWGYSPVYDVYRGPGVGASGPLSLDHAFHGNSPKAFFRLTGVLYPVTTVPEHLSEKTITVGLGTPHAIRFAFGAGGANAAAAYHRYSDGSQGALDYEYTVTGPYSAELHVTSPGLDEATYTLYFGGKNLNVSSSEKMSAEIQYTGFNAFDSHFTMLP